MRLTDKWKKWIKHASHLSITDDALTDPECSILGNNSPLRAFYIMWTSAIQGKPCVNQEESIVMQDSYLDWEHHSAEAVVDYDIYINLYAWYKQYEETNTPCFLELKSASNQGLHIRFHSNNRELLAEFVLKWL